MDDVKEASPYFVSTRWYLEGIAALEYHKIIIITGNPGVGKSTLTKMLALYCVDNGYSLRCVSTNDPDNLKAAMLVDRSIKELVIMDDFIGQRYEDIIQVKEGSLLSLIKYITSSENKILIMNTRMAVYRNANERFEKLRRYLKMNPIHEIQINDFSKDEKAEILRNFLLRNEAVYNIPHIYYESILANQAYKQIISHKNYSPRIIEMAMIPHQVKKTPPDKFVASILAKLDNPEDIWKGAFANIAREDKILLFVLFSLTQTTVNYDVLKKCFWSRIRLSPSIDTTETNYESIQNRLADSFLRFFRKESADYAVGFANPSVADYIESVFSGNEAEREKLINSAVYYEQIFNCVKQDANTMLSWLEENVKNNILKYEFLYNRRDWDNMIALAIAKSQTCQENYREFLTEWLQKHNFDSYEGYLGKYTYGDILIQLFREPAYSFYGLSRYVSDNEAYLNFTKYTSLEDTIRIADHILPMLNHDIYTELLSVISEQINEMLYEYVCYFEVISFCEERLERNDYHDEIQRLWENAKNKKQESAEFFGEIYYYDDNDDDAPFESGIISSALYNMAVSHILKTLKGYVDAIADSELRNLISIPNPEEILDDGEFYNHIESMFQFASHDMMILMSMEKDNLRSYSEAEDRVDRLFRND
jgi:energy-coupling factor transporter ATP-binding protein EcfA2